MDTPILDEKINDLEILNSAGELNSKGNEALIEFKAIKLALNIDDVSKKQIEEAEQRGYDKGHFEALMKMVK
tara:strand:- start:296 stop:511 length:216 start_codon:yes stop_codon:yes gene_type:complete